MAPTRSNAKISNLDFAALVSEIGGPDKRGRPRTKTPDAATSATGIITNTATRTSDARPTNSAIQGSLESIGEPVSEIFAGLDDPQTSSTSVSMAMKFLIASMQAMSSKIDSLCEVVTNGQADNALMMEKINVLATELYETQKENVVLKREVQKLAQQSVKDTVVFHGIPDNVDEQLVVQKVGKLLNVDIEKHHFNDFYRIRPLDNNKHAPLVVKLNSRKIKDALIAGRKGKSLFSSDIDLQGARTQIYLNEYLTSEMMKLFVAAKRLSRELEYKYVWARNGAIFAKKEDKSKKIHIQDHQQILDLIAEK